MLIEICREEASHLELGKITYLCFLQAHNTRAARGYNITDQRALVVIAKAANIPIQYFHEIRMNSQPRARTGKCRCMLMQMQAKEYIDNELTEQQT